MVKLADWTRDYAHLARGNAVFRRKPPRHYLGEVQAGKVPVILLSGLSQKWQFLKHLGNRISRLGHPVYTISNLGRNHLSIARSAELIHEVIRQQNLKHIVIIAHSKGGLIGKYLLAHYNSDRSIRKVIAVATPFSGSRLARSIPHHAYRELLPDSETIQNLNALTKVNRHIISIIPEFDNHVWAVQGSYLEGAENINVAVRGHHKVVFAKEVEQVIEDVLAKESR